mgnify:CR=1 FL=1
MILPQPGNFLLLTAWLWLVPGLLNAQFEHKLFNSNLLVEGKVHYGFIYAQHLELELFNAHFPAFEVNIQQQTYGKRQWERDYNYPIIGVTLFHSPMGDHPVLGHAWAAMPFINFPLIRKNHFSAGFRLGLGIGYLTKKFDRLTNYKNLAIGSHFNAAVNLMGEARYDINDAWTISGGISLQHFSNGSLKLPNYGVNLPLTHLGVAYRPFRQNPNITTRFIAPTQPFSVIVRNWFEVNLGIYAAYKNMTAVYGKNYLVSHGFLNAFYQVSPKSKFGIGFDLSYDPSHITKLESSGDTVTNTLNILRPGINGGYELVMSKLGFIFNLGYYLGGQERSNGPLYQKISVRYGFGKDFFATVMLKVHWGRADYIGWGVGYRFKVFYGKKLKQ